MSTPNAFGVLSDFSSKVELNQRLSGDQDRQRMAFPHIVEEKKNTTGQLPYYRQTYHFNGNTPMFYTDMTSYDKQSDALVRKTPKTMSLIDHGVSTSIYQVEHLASFQHESKDVEITPEIAVARLNIISKDGGVFSQLMLMNVSDDLLVMRNSETMEFIEEYALESINLCAHIISFPLIEELLVFSTKFSNDKVGAIHLFHCNPSQADVIAADINRRRFAKLKNMSGAVINGGFSENEPLGPDFPNRIELNTDDSIGKKNLDNFGYSHDGEKSPTPVHGPGVHQRVEAYQKIVESPRTTELERVNSRSSFEYGSRELRQAKINRDVETLNHCIDEIEGFVVDLKKMNDARKKLNRKGYKTSMKKKYEHDRNLAKGPEKKMILDIYQKFKCSFNLLGKLQSHIENPNAPELVHYIFVPLQIIVKILGLEQAAEVVSPLLTVAAIDLLSNCLSPNEKAFWTALGHNWFLPASAPTFRNKAPVGYIPVFKDGWTPPEIVIDDRSAAAAKSAASMVERMKIVEEEEVQKKKVMEEQSSLEETQHYDVVPTPVPAVVPAAEQLEEKSPKPTGKPTDLPKLQLNADKKYALVIYDYWAHNNKELTIRSGEKVQVLDDSRRWWLVKNEHEEQGYIPSTVLDVSLDNASETSSADSSVSPATSPLGNGRITKTTIKKVEVVKSEEDISTQPTVVTAKSIITESKQFSNPPTPIATAPVTVVSQQESATTASSDKNEPPQFMPPPPPMVLTDEPEAEISSEQPPKIMVREEKIVMKTSIPEKTFQEELSDRLNVNDTSNGMTTLATVDKVDFFIPLFKSSTADDVARWLKRMKFDSLTVESLSGVAAKELFKYSEEELVEKLGEDEGKRLHNELQVQIGAMTRHKTMTEFQKALLARMKRQEVIQKNVTKHQVTIKSGDTHTAVSQAEMQRKFKEQQDLIRAQGNADSSREPKKQTFSTFQGEASATSDKEISPVNLEDDSKL